MFILKENEEFKVQCLGCFHFIDTLTEESIKITDNGLTLFTTPCKYCLKKEYLAGLDKGNLSGFELGFNAGKAYAHL